MIFGDFYNIFVFIEKGKNERKEKRFTRAWSSPQRSQFNCKDSTQVKKKPIRRSPLGCEHFTSGTLIYFKNY
jgi:hypothetical protein